MIVVVVDLISDAAEIVFAPKNKTVLEYDNVTFFCNALSAPSQIIWTQEGTVQFCIKEKPLSLKMSQENLMDRNTNVGHGTMSPKIWKHMLNSLFIVSIK